MKVSVFTFRFTLILIIFPLFYLTSFPLIGIVESSPLFKKYLSESKGESQDIYIQAMPDKDDLYPGDNFYFFLMVDLVPGWHIYSLKKQDVEEDIATKILMDPNQFIWEGEWQESDPQLVKDVVLEKVMKTHSKRVEFSHRMIVPQKISPGTYSLQGKLTYSTCNNKICSLPRQKRFISHVIVKKK